MARVQPISQIPKVTIVVGGVLFLGLAVVLGLNSHRYGSPPRLTIASPDLAIVTSIPAQSAETSAPSSVVLSSPDGKTQVRISIEEVTAVAEPATPTGRATPRDRRGSEVLHASSRP